MKINELEKLLGVSKANIRFYESEGLLAPARSQNNYRDYSEADLLQLKEILVLRKLGLAIPEIRAVREGELPLQEAVAASAARLMEEKKRLEGAIALCHKIQAGAAAETFDAEQYWQLILSEETRGNDFMDLAKDYLMFERRILLEGLARTHFIDAEGLLKKYGVGKGLLLLVGLFLFRAIMAHQWRGESILNAFLAPFVVMLAVALITLPLFLLMKKNQKLAMLYSNLLLGICALFVLGLLTGLALSLLGIW